MEPTRDQDGLRAEIRDRGENGGIIGRYSLRHPREEVVGILNTIIDNDLGGA
jgi:hypothetical protein